jgi:hypothetical protein
LQGKYECTHYHYGAIGKNQELAGKLRHRDHNHQHQQSNHSEKIVLREQFVTRASYDKNNDSGGADKRAEKQHGLKENPHPADA